MKHVIYIAVFLVPTVFFAQEKPTNVSEETTTKTVTVDDGREVVEKKVKVTTREEQQIKLAESDKHKVNQDVVDSPSKVTQTIEVDNDMDPFFDSKTKSVHYTYNDDNYIFKRNDNGFIVSEVGADARSEEHTSELQSRENLVCRLLLEKKKKKNNANIS